MSMRIDPQTILRQSTLRKQEESRRELKKTGEKLASGQRINRAADDAAGLAIGNKMTEELRALEQGMRNLYDGASLLQTAEGGLDSMSGNLHRMRELAMGASSDLVNQDQRRVLQQEFEALKAEIDRASADTRFGGRHLLDGSSGAIEFSTGQSGSREVQAITVDLSRNLDAQSLGLGASRIGGPDSRNALLAMEDIDHALGSVGTLRAEFGAAGNRLVGAQRNLAITAESTYEARSMIMDTDYALETSQLARQQILAQAGQAVQVQFQGLSALTRGLLR